MNNINELINSTVTVLRNNTIFMGSSDKPRKPFCVVYLGDESEKYHDELFSDLECAWGKSVASEALFFLVSSSDNYNIYSFPERSPVSIDSISENIRHSSRKDGFFAERGSIELYYILDSKSIKNPSEFDKWYLLAREAAKSSFQNIKTTSTLILILREYGNAKKSAMQIKSKILELSQHPEFSTTYDTTFIFSDTDFNNAPTDILASGESNSDFNLLSNIILLTNSSNQREAISILRSNDAIAFTASYGYLQKPTFDIVKVTLKTILKKVLEKANNTNFDSSLLSDALGIHYGNCEINQEFYNSFRNSLPPNNFINYLPNDISTTMSFSAADDKSCGCLSAFLEADHFQKVDSEFVLQKNKMILSVIDRISSKITADMLKEGISSESMNNILSQISTGNLRNASNSQIFPAIEAKVKAKAATYINEVIEEGLNRSITQAKNCWDSFAMLVADVNGDTIDSNSNIETFYSQMALNYLSGQITHELCIKIFKITNSWEDILDILLDTMQKCFNSNSDYKLSYFAELSKRLGLIDSANLTDLVSGELTSKNAKDNILFNTQYGFQDQKLEVYFMDNGSDNYLTIIKKGLKSRSSIAGITQSFLNVNRRDKVEAVWFYKCAKESLEI